MSDFQSILEAGRMPRGHSPQDVAAGIGQWRHEQEYLARLDAASKRAQARRKRHQELARKGAEILAHFKATVPTLTGDEAQHNQALQIALAAIDELIQQEIAEGDHPEYECLVVLAGIGAQLVAWANGEAIEYDDELAPSTPGAIGSIVDYDQ